MRIGVATVFHKKLWVTDAVKLLSEFSDHIMISPIYREINGEDIKELKEIKDSLGLEYYVHGLFPNRGRDPKRDGYDLDLIKESIENAYKLESEHVIIHCSRKEFYERDIKILNEAYKISEKYGIILSVENIPDEGSMLRLREDFLKVIEDVPDLNICFDISHYFLLTGNSKVVADVIREFRDRIKIFHISDAWFGEDLQTLPGYGSVNWLLIGKELVKFNLKKTPFIIESLYPVNLAEGIRNFRHIILINL